LIVIILQRLTPPSGWLAVRGRKEEDEMARECPECNGTGWIVCPLCHGKGYDPAPPEDVSEVFSSLFWGGDECPECHGEGGWECPHCNGTGEVG
jgi:RecJ-like exonuclease